MHRWIPWLMIGGAILHIVLGFFDPPWPAIVGLTLIAAARTRRSAGSLAGKGLTEG